MDPSTFSRSVSFADAEGLIEFERVYQRKPCFLETRTSARHCTSPGDNIVKKIMQANDHTAHQVMIEVLVHLGIVPLSIDIGGEALFMPPSSTIIGKPTSFFDAQNPEWKSQAAHWQFRYEVTSTRKPMQVLNEIPIVYTAVCIIGHQKFSGEVSLTRERARRSVIAKALRSIQKQLHKDPSLRFLKHCVLNRKVKSTNWLDDHMRLHILRTSQKLYFTQSNAVPSSRFEVSKEAALSEYLRIMRVEDKVSFDICEVQHTKQQTGIFTRNPVETKVKALCYAVGRTFIGQSKNSMTEATESAAENATAFLRSVPEFPFASFQYLKLVRFLDRYTSEKNVRPEVCVLRQNRTVVLKIGDSSLKYCANHTCFTAMCSLSGFICLGISTRSYGSALEMAATAALRHLLRNPMAKSCST